jgi:hypothetical protein
MPPARCPWLSSRKHQRFLTRMERRKSEIKASEAPAPARKHHGFGDGDSIIKRLAKVEKRLAQLEDWRTQHCTELDPGCNCFEKESAT